jgi:hypothetical protein
MGEELAIALRAQLRGVTIVRPGPVYGPGQSRFGLLARFVRALKRREPIAIAAPHGRLVSPVFVGDVVDVIVASLAQPANVTMSVGGPRAYRERQLVEDLAEWLALPCSHSRRQERAAVAIRHRQRRRRPALPDAGSGRHGLMDCASRGAGSSDSERQRLDVPPGGQRRRRVGIEALVAAKNCSWWAPALPLPGRERHEEERLQVRIGRGEQFGSGP